MKIDRSYFIVDHEATMSLIRKIPARPGHAGEIRLYPRQIPDCSGDYAIMPRFEIYGRAKPSGTYRRLFIVTGNHLLQPLARAPLSLFLILAFLLLFIGRTRECTFNALVEDDHPRYRAWECMDKHEIQLDRTVASETFLLYS